MGVTAKVRRLVLQRANDRCEVCYGNLDGWDGYSLQHRIPRGMGGTKRAWINQPANLIAVCGSATTGCHGHMESERLTAISCGWLLPSQSDPLTQPFRDVGGYWWLLDNDGHKHPTPPPNPPGIIGGTAT